MTTTIVHGYVDNLIDNTDGKFDKFESAWIKVPIDWLRKVVLDIGFTSVKDFYDTYTYDDTDGIFAMAIEEGVLLGCGAGDMTEERVYEVQSYVVKFDLGPVDVNINVYHQNQTELTREEILEEAFGYAQDVGIELSERDLFEIETIEMKEA